jgi:hypothetical protein
MLRHDKNKTTVDYKKHITYLHFAGTGHRLIIIIIK